MAFTIKSWHNKGEGTSTPINAAALKDIETRLSAYSDGLIAALTVGTSMLASGAVTAAKIGSEAVEEAKIKAEAVGTGKLANLAVTTAKIADSAVTAAKIAEGAITATKIAEGAITETKLGAAAVTDAKLEKPIVAGIVNTAGEIKGGSDFTVTRTTTGVYKIELTTELASFGSLIATSEPGALVGNQSQESKKVFEVKITNSTSGALENHGFHFQVKAT